MKNRAPWALTVYFGFFLLLLVWGRLPEEPSPCANVGLRMLGSTSYQSIAERLPSPFCPACNDPRQGAGTAAVPLSVSNGTPCPDGKNSSVFHTAFLPRPSFANHGAGSRIHPFPPLPDARLASLRTVVLLN